LQYDSYGRVIAESQTSETSRYGYTARELDVETGLYYYRARYYDSALGTFISEDPLGFWGGGGNLHRYVTGDPLSYADPLGTNPDRDVYFDRDPYGSFDRAMNRVRDLFTNVDPIPGRPKTGFNNHPQALGEAISNLQNAITKAARNGEWDLVRRLVGFQQELAHELERAIKEAAKSGKLAECAAKYKDKLDVLNKVRDALARGDGFKVNGLLGPLDPLEPFSPGFDSDLRRMRENGYNIVPLVPGSFGIPVPGIGITAAKPVMT